MLTKVNVTTANVFENIPQLWINEAAIFWRNEYDEMEIIKDNSLYFF